MHTRRVERASALSRSRKHPPLVPSSQTSESEAAAVPHYIILSLKASTLLETNHHRYFDAL